MRSGAPVTRPSKTAPEPELSASSLVTANSERTTGFEPAPSTLAIAWRMSHESQSVSPVSLSWMVLTLLSHTSHQIAQVASISLVISFERSSRGRLLRLGARVAGG
jgi:hypothetical protein